MPDRLLHWNAQALQAQLDPLLPGLRVQVLERVASTNTVLLERARGAGAQEAPDAALAIVRRSVESAAFGPRSVDVQPCLLVAEQQTGGRGRQGRAWHSAPGASLTFSLALPLRVADWAGLSLAVGVAVADALDALDARADPERVRIGLKWPNDLWLMNSAGEGRKLGGILIETITIGTSRLAVIGIGLNVRSIELSDASTGFASLQELDRDAMAAAVPTAPSVLHRLALPLALALQQFEVTGFSAFADRFAARDLLRGRTVRTTQPGVPEGIAQGVSLHGALLVQTAAGLLPVTSGEVSVRMTGAPMAEPPAGPAPEFAPRRGDETLVAPPR